MRRNRWVVARFQPFGKREKELKVSFSKRKTFEYKNNEDVSASAYVLNSNFLVFIMCNDGVVKFCLPKHGALNDKDGK